NGTAGVNGEGRDANPALYDATIATGAGSCSSTNNRSYVNGGARVCGTDVVSGGHGGGNRCTPASNLTQFSGLGGDNGQAGSSPGGGAAGVFGDAGDDGRLESGGALCFVPAAPMFGMDGTAGARGAHAAAVSGCSSAAGSVSGGHWIGGAAA